MEIRSTLAAVVAMTLATTGAVVATATPAHATTSVIQASADAYVQQTSAGTNYGTLAQLQVDNSPVRRTFLSFTVSGVDATIGRARLRLHTISGNDGSDTGGTVTTLTDTTWSETGVTWNNQPTIDGTTLGSLGAVTASTWYELEVTDAVTGNGTYSFALTSTSTDGAYYDAREAGWNGPQLILDLVATVGGDPVLVGAADIALCSSTGDEATANLLDGIDGTIFTAGDNSQGNGVLSEYTDCYASSWGRHKDRIRPAAGNHDYATSGAAGYYGYFGSLAGTSGKGYYSYDLGDWHVVALNSNCSSVGGCNAGSVQEQWLRADLAASTKQCTVAYWHHPLFTSSSGHAPTTAVRPLFQALYDADAEIVMSGHNHTYERFAPQTPTGTLDNAGGIRQFVVGTGGASHYSFGATMANSEVRNNDTYGVLKLTLKSGRYDWQFVPQSGKTFTDTGSGTCH